MGSVYGLHDRLENLENMLAEAPGVSIQALRMMCGNGWIS